MSKYVDRGIIKWSPFDGLAGFNDLFTELRNRLTRIDKPTLLEDRLEELDLKLQSVLKNNQNTLFEYFYDGHIRYAEGHILKIDSIQRIILLDSKQKIALKDILEIYEIQT